MGEEITELLLRARTGEPERLSQVFEALYPQLRRLAASRLHAGERTFTPTMLVHELYLHATCGQVLSVADRRHFFTAAAQAMRWILVDNARRRGADKRGGAQPHVPLDDAVAVCEPPPVDYLALQDSLEALGEINPQQREVVELHYFAGLEFAEIAELQGCSVRTAHRNWERARAFLHAQLASA